MRIVKWSGQAKVDFVNILGYLYQNWSEKEARNFLTEIKRLTHILEKGNIEFKKSKFRKLHIAVITEQISVYYRIHSSKRVEIVRVWDNRQRPSKLLKS
jgi:plasmid stabilization system protein ParE